MANQLGKIDHIVELMLENRSFDHMLGFLYADSGNRSPTGQAFDGLTGEEWNPDDLGRQQRQGDRKGIERPRHPQRSRWQMAGHPGSAAGAGQALNRGLRLRGDGRRATAPHQPRPTERPGESSANTSAGN
jgi:hypothetical protein